LSFGLGVAAFVVLLLFAIFFHELGHYLTARWSGIKISQFFIGFGPTLWSRRGGRLEVVETPDGELVERPETEYGIKALPLGGYVKVLGMSPFEDVPPEEHPRSFQAVSYWKRAVVLLAGSVTHFITASVVIMLILTVVGLPDPDRPTLRVSSLATELEDGTQAPAFKAGIEPGDRIVAVDGNRFEDWDAMRDYIRDRPGQRLTVTVVRGERELQLPITPAPTTEEGREIGVIGVSPEFESARLGPLAAARLTGQVLWRSLGLFVQATPRALSPRNLGLIPGADPSPEERPISIYGAGRIAADLAARGRIAMFMEFFANINIFIGLFNLLPLPPLDGGHLLLLGIERLRRKPLGQRALGRVMAVGFALLLLVGVSLLFRDILSPAQLPF